ncbi:bifunctional 4-hydroxy-2-oxoglutarate aldolase/2-dehydro-3-deoxy-phosphogluconate aldolase [Heyndrickxia oleronia]|uniref:Bifunctional 4-hydroxy-2-oxoglutarate aldolase/2-dehydro-3-deoxy-phosphogluconate aldolase n=1 Tax=Heyndrickxia oleronia TaxID=38875 RepID=A0AAW6SYR5_9BACI|nr:bifunctional 4-hydroxy-2-oxoglutarate aldolase/2-dehydro-3-deoxy-phosphogluconate aldolase [Heyndrickxia oleronia]MCM3240364.1 bifunctional 4-hydroxy-2-oxoglutarate aldolase/2-dehydro-3-deoxy-phosphogluconate aldolase [Heyndrickxia oleronia]MDH5161977.1 bifunctional 4-hydroxy-2-oxoglutarate aldolase/2-dehydro-3-deoxy-phosphogluconate aldolase [Heyndrickxia oleronia]
MSVLKRLNDEKIVAILRHIPVDKVNHTVEALRLGGVKILEVTMNSEGALQSIVQLRNQYSNEQVVVGAGTILDLKMAKEAVAAGAEFLISPNLDEEVISYAVDQGIDIWPGVMTPSEMVKAWNAGARAIKLFPAGILGPTFVKDVRAPLGHIPIIATGGISLQNLRQFFDAGAMAVGLGGQLLKKNLIANNSFENLQELAAQFVKSIPKESGTS